MARAGGSPDDASRHIVTGGRAPRDAWRGVRDTDRGVKPRRPGEPADPVGRVEVEELPAQPVMPRGGPKLGLAGTLAVGAMAVLLAAGFGVLGGRPDSTPAPTRAAIASPDASDAAPTPPPVAHPTPLVTPWTACGAEPSPDRPPVIQLQVNGLPHDSHLAEVGAPVARPDLRPPLLSPDRPIEPVLVPVDVISELWIEGAACAQSWFIELFTPGGDGVLLASMPDRGPVVAAQNRFPLDLQALDGGRAVLRAILGFGTMTASAEWVVDVRAVEPPVAALEGDDGPIELVTGCDVTITLGTGYVRSLNPCADDVAAPPIEIGVVEPGEQLRFDLDGWGISDGQVFCGRLNGQSFVAVPQPGCLTEAHDVTRLDFVVPPEPGRWTLAISACASAGAILGPGLNHVCGTWYANIEVRLDD